MSTYSFVCLFVFLSAYSSVLLSPGRMSIYLPVHVSIWLLSCLFFCLSVLSSAWALVCPAACLSVRVCLSVACPFICLPVHVSVWLLSSLFVSLVACLSISSLVCVSAFIRLPVCRRVVAIAGNGEDLFLVVFAPLFSGALPSDHGSYRAERPSRSPEPLQESCRPVPGHGSVSKAAEKTAGRRQSGEETRTRPLRSHAGQRRCGCAGQVSITSTEPQAYRPPEIGPTTARNCCRGSSRE